MLALFLQTAFSFDPIIFHFLSAPLTTSSFAATFAASTDAAADPAADATANAVADVRTNDLRSAVL